MKPLVIKYKDKAEYNIKWETIYAEKDISEEELEEFIKDLKTKGYKIIHIVTGKDGNKILKRDAEAK